ncbi:unnamed protein product [Calypogeia fissa]
MRRKGSHDKLVGLLFIVAGDFFRDLSVNLLRTSFEISKQSRRRASKPKSLWEELADIGEEFVEFLETTSMRQVPKRKILLVMKPEM